MYVGRSCSSGKTSKEVTLLPICLVILSRPLRRRCNSTGIWNEDRVLNHERFMLYRTADLSFQLFIILHRVIQFFFNLLGRYQSPDKGAVRKDQCWRSFHFVPLACLNKC